MIEWKFRGEIPWHAAERDFTTQYGTVAGMHRFTITIVCPSKTKPYDFDRILIDIGKDRRHLRVPSDYPPIRHNLGPITHLGDPIAAGHVLVRGLKPRINEPYLFVILEDCLDKVPGLNITEDDMKGMDW